MPGSELGTRPGAPGRTPPDAQEAGAAHLQPLSPRVDADLQQKASLLFGHFRCNGRRTNKELGRPLLVEARVCILSPDWGPSPGRGGPSSAIGILCTCRPLPVTGGHGVSFTGIRTSNNRREAPRACRPSPLCWRGASMPAACAAKAHPRPLPCVCQLSDGKGCSGRERRAQGLGPGEGGTPAPPGSPQAWGQRGFHRWQARPGQRPPPPLTDSTLQHAAN